MENNENKQILESLYQQQMMADIGSFNNDMTDTLYVMGCMFPGILNCRLEISVGNEEGKERYIKYTLLPKSWILHRLSEYFQNRHGIIAKIAQIILIKLKAPIFIKEDLVFVVKNYLKSDYDVRIEFAKQ